MKTVVIFYKTKDDEIELYRQNERCFAQEGRDWLESLQTFGNQLFKTLSNLKVGDQLVMRCEIKETPRGKDMA